MRSSYVLALVLSVSVGAFAQSSTTPSTPNAPEPQAQSTTAPEATAPQAQQEKPAEPPPNGAITNPAEPSTRAANKEVPVAKQQPKRILGIMPNYRAVSAGATPPPPTAGQAFKLATQNSFDFSSFIFVGVTSAIAEGTDAHPKLGKGMPGFGRYYWRGFLDKTDGNYLVIWALPTIFHEDERYFSLGHGSFWKRAGYASSRIFITPNYEGHNTFNFAEVLGRAGAQGIATTYYPSTDRTVSNIASKYAYALMRDAATNTFREFWPDIASHLHKKQR